MKYRRSRIALLPLLALIAASALVFASCGGDNGDDGATAAAEEAEVAATEENGPGEPLDQNEFIAAVSEICDRSSSEASERGLDADFETDAAEDPDAFGTELKERWEMAEEIFGGAMEDLRQINAPDGQADDYEEFLAGTERTMELSTEAMNAWADDPDFTMSEEDMQEQQELTTRQDTLMESLGIPADCFSATP